MLKSVARNDAWTRIAYRHHTSSNVRCIATASAIHKGLRRTKGAPELSYAARPRAPRPDGPGGRYHERPERPYKKEKKHPSAKDLRPVGARPMTGWPGSKSKSPPSGRPSYGNPEMSSYHKSERRSVDRRDSGDRDTRYQKSTSRSMTEQSRRPERYSRASPREQDAEPPAYDRKEKASSYKNDRRTERSESYRSRRDQDESIKDEFDDNEYVERRPKKSNQISVAVEYTTPASEFLYGTSVVEAALKSSRRKLYKLYMLGGEKKRDEANFWKMQQAAMKRGVPVSMLDNTSLLDKMSAGRLHNGYVLEGSPLMKPPIQHLLEVDGLGAREFRFEAGTQSDEDLEINGNDNKIDTQSNQLRYPFVLFLDGVQDTGNFGGILRTAHFLGVDAVVMSSTCAPLNAVVLKASAGAAESLPLMHVHDTSGFVEASRTNGWTFYASIPPPSSQPQSKRQKSRHNSTDTMASPLPNGPCVLMIGGEGSGLKQDLVKRADATVSIASNRRFKTTVDSLNVSVATGMLANAFLNIPRGATKEQEPNEDDAPEHEEPEIEHLERKEGEVF